MYIFLRLQGYEHEEKLNIYVLAQRLLLYFSFDFYLYTF